MQLKVEYKFLLLLALASSILSNTNDLIVKIKDGKIRGKYMTTRGGRTIAGYTSIQYAEAPIGNLRFEPPVPIKPWNGVKNATEPTKICVQIDSFNLTNPTLIQGDEDCLYLNVFTPKTVSNNYHSLPIMFYIHGGGYTFGHNNYYQPDYLLDHDIILVAPNYRLNALGFLATGDMVVPGNMGLKDQNLALKWTRENIKAFGGDPDKITLVGQSCGAASVHFHMMSPLSKGLFQKAILQSASSMDGWAFSKNDVIVSKTKTLASSFNCSLDSEQMVNCLRLQNPYDILAASAQFTVFVNTPLNVFTPVAEPNHTGAFLTKHPKYYLESGEIAKIPLLTGINTDEGAYQTSILLSNPPLLTQFSDNFYNYVPISLSYIYWMTNTTSMTKELHEFYFDGKPVTSDLQANITNLFMDGWFLAGVSESLHQTLKLNLASLIYVYLNGYQGSVSITQLFGDPNRLFGVSHFDELFNLFPFHKELFPNSSPTPDDIKMIELFTTLWYNFITIGNPTPRNSHLPFKWLPVKTKKIEYFDIRGPNRLRMKERLYFNRTRFWKRILKEYVNPALRFD